MGSDLSAFSNDLIGELLIEIPDGLACFIITVPGFFKEFKISKPVNISL